MGRPVQVVRDAYGVPHLFGKTHEEVFEAYGYVVAQDRLWQLELNRRAARGTLAQVLGARYVSADQVMRLTGYTEDELTQQLAALPPHIAAGIEAYARGINRALVEVQADPNRLLPYEFHRLKFFPAPWKPTDTIAFGAFMLRRFGEIGGQEVANQVLLQDLRAKHGAEAAQAIFDDFLWRNDPAAPTTVPTQRAVSTWRMYPQSLPAAASHFLPDIFPSLAAAMELWAGLGVPSKLGSYGWVLRPERTTEGVAMLYGGPQMNWSTPEVVHEVQLTSEEGLNVDGMAFAGVPLVLIGHNADVAWTSTTAVGDNVDYYAEALCDAGAGPRSGSRFHDACVPLARRQEIIEVRGAEPVIYEVVRTLHGPAVVIESLNEALAQKRAHWQREAQSFVGFTMFNLAHDLDSFAAGVPFIVTAHNFLYADRLGNIAYWQAGEVPVRALGYDFRLPLPGDGQAEWTGKLVPVPSSINPAQGYLANWNNKPSADYDSADSRFFGKQWRLVDLQQRLQGNKVSWEDMHTIPKDIARVDELGRETRYLLPLMLAAVQAAPPTSPLAEQALEVLQDYTGEAFADAIASDTLLPGFVVFGAWKEALMQRLFAPLFTSGLPSNAVNVLIHVLEQRCVGTTSLPPHYDYFQGQDANDLIRDALQAAVQDLADQLGDDPAAWNFPRPSIDFEHPLLGHIASIPLANRATYAQVLRVAPAGISGENIWSLGQSAFVRWQGPGKFRLDPHFDDLLPLYRGFAYKPMQLLPPPSSQL